MRILFFIFFIGTTSLLSAQQHSFLGQYFDLAGQPLRGDFDDAVYMPERMATLTYDLSKNYSLGNVYYANGTARSVAIKPVQDGRKVMVKGKNRARSVSPDKIQSFSVGLDSFVVMRNFYFHSAVTENVGQQESRIFEVVNNIEDLDLLRYMFSGIRQDYSSYYLYKKGGMLQLLSKDIVQRKSEINALINGGIERYIPSKYGSKSKDMDTSKWFNFVRYKKIFDNQSKIFFNQYGYEVKGKEKASHYGIIDRFVRNSYKISYYSLSGDKIKTITYKDLFPHQVGGKTVWYNQEGKLRKSVMTTQNGSELRQKYMIYDSEEEPIEVFNYTCQVKKGDDGINPLENTLVNQVAKGINYYKSRSEVHFVNNPSRQDVYYDSIREHKVFYSYQNQQKGIFETTKLQEVYYLNESEEKTYMYIDGYRPKISMEALSDFLSQSLAISITNPELVQGFILLKVNIQRDGTKKVELLKGLERNIDYVLTGSAMQYLSILPDMTVKRQKEKVNFEFILPIYLETKGYTERVYKPNSNWYQMMYMQNRTLPPTFVR
ncbi:hypothetical protein [Algivirga pacifica]|uniref:Uncharacterized protein n=1 Tax=Algivirga pacifica TaxID=1162670 RepID=A0ABP9D4M2_9BACT